MFQADVRTAAKRMTDGWWWFLIAGGAWLIISVLVLRFDVTSVATVGYLLGALFLVAGLDEFFVASIRGSWAWARVLLGVLFVFGAIWSFASPFNAFWALASVFGLLLIFRGTLDVVQSTTTRAINPLWGLGLATGILEILLGFWVSQQFVPARASLLILWVGFMALFRGFSEIVLAFQLRGARQTGDDRVHRAPRT
jgi:uncharacterized membrane protein HdeD (DUF308 family)